MVRHQHVTLGDRNLGTARSLTGYDAAYVALAETLKVPVMTCERRLSHATGHAAHVELSAEREV